MNIKNFAQYFTTNDILKKKIVEFIRNKPNVILEPSVGRGDLLHAVQTYYKTDNISNIHFDCYEIDKTISFLKFIDSKKRKKLKTSIHYTDFLNENITKKYKTIIGNPPFLRTKNGNMCMFFFKKCIELLEPGGEIIFVLPSDFFKLTSTEVINKIILNHGKITDIFHPNREDLFKNVNIDVLVMRFCLDKSLPNTVSYNEIQKQVHNNDGMVVFTEIKLVEPVMKIFLGQIFNIYVGLVSGRESIFKQYFGNMKILNDENRIVKYVYADKYPSGIKKIDTWLFKNKKQLLERRIRKFNEKNWFEWGAPRNISIMKKHFGEPCIYIRMQTRKKKVAFVGTIQYFGAQLIMLQPKPERKDFLQNNGINLETLINFFNSPDFKENYTYSGRFRIGQRMIVQTMLPIY